jgi:hypothetical protein
MRRIRRDERGSALIIALGFLLLFSLWVSATLASTESGLRIGQTMRVQPKRLYAADGAIEQTIQKIRYDDEEGTYDDNDCGNEVTLENPPQTVYVKCEPDTNSGRGDEGESSPPVGIIAVSNGGPLNNEYAYQQYGNSILRIDGGVYSGTPLLFQNGSTCNPTGNSCQQLNVCPRNRKEVKDATVQKNNLTIAAQSNPFALGDIGVPITGFGVPSGTTIAAYVTPGLIGMSKVATASGSPKSVFIREDYPRLQQWCHVPTAAEDPTGEIRRKGKITGVPRTVGGESCDETIVVTLQFNCDAQYLPDPIGVDPGYPVDKFSGFNHQDPPPCGTSNVVQLQPGKYDNAAALTALTTTCDKLIWFTPGTYLFDFSDPGPPVWTIGGSSSGNLTVVGGAKTWTGEPFRACVSTDSSKNPPVYTVTTSGGIQAFKNAAVGDYVNAGYNLPYGATIKSIPPSGGFTTATLDVAPLTNNWCGLYTVSPRLATTNPALGSLCNPDSTLDHGGVEFIFNGSSRMVLSDGKTELCSPVDGNKQQIAIYGARTTQAQVRTPEIGSCITVQPYDPNGSSTCALVKAPQGSKPAFLVHGTIYAPLAAIDLSLQGVGYQVVSRGIISRVVVMSISPSSQYTKPVIYSPNFGSVPGAPRRMVLTACVEAACDDGGKPKLRALVRIQDADDNNNPGVPGYKVFIESWSVL